MRKPVGIVLSLLFLAAGAVPFSGQQHPGAARVSRLLLIIPCENTVLMSSLKLQPTADLYPVMAQLDLEVSKSASAAQNLDHALTLEPANAFGAALKRIQIGNFGQSNISASLR